jgi:hypothetical protein
MHARTLPILLPGVKLVNEHISNATDVDDFPCFLHVQLVRLLTEWHQAHISLATDARSQQERMEDVNALMQMATSILPYACSPTSPNHSEVKRTLTLMFICIRCIFGWRRTTGDTSELQWLSGVLKPPVQSDATSSLLTQLEVHTDPECMDEMALLYFSMAKHELMYTTLQRCTCEVERVEDDETWDHVNDASATALVEAANADFGVQVFRELISTFRVPRERLPPRRTIFYHKDIRRVLERDYFDIMNEAHHIATQTPLKVWTHGVVPVHLLIANDIDLVDKQDSKKLKTYLDGEHSIEEQARKQREQTLSDTDSTLERMCAVLAGVFVNLVDDVDRARTDDAFFGRVELPCFQTISTKQSPQAIKLFGFHGEWFAYNISAGQLKVHARGGGLRGLCACAAKVVAHHHLSKNS